MTREEFEQALIPLTPNELVSQINPNQLSEKYKNQIYSFVQFNMAKSIHEDSIKNAIFYSDSNILPQLYSKNYKSPHIALNRNDRYVNVLPHNHAYIELNYVFSGTCTTLINSKRINLTAGDICIMDRHVVHTILPTGMDDIILNIMIAKEFFTNSFINRLSNGGAVAKFLADVIEHDNEHNQYLLFHTLQNYLVKELIENLFIEYLNPGICCDDVLSFNLNLLFIELARCYQGDMERQHKQRSKPYLTEILNYMETHFADCTLEDVAKKFNFHPNYLSRMIKAETGSNFQEILDESRMKRASFLLKNSDLPIYKIITECGYQNQNFFYKKFHKNFGQTPNAYRNT